MRNRGAIRACQDPLFGCRREESHRCFMENNNNNNFPFPQTFCAWVTRAGKVLIWLHLLCLELVDWVGGGGGGIRGPSLRSKPVPSSCLPPLQALVLEQGMRLGQPLNSRNLTDSLSSPPPPFLCVCAHTSWNPTCREREKWQAQVWKVSDPSHPHRSCLSALDIFEL